LINLKKHSSRRKSSAVSRADPRFHETQHKFRENLCDSFNTPRAIETLLDLVATINKYLTDRGQGYNIGPVKLAAEWITRMLSMFGLGEGAITAAEGQIGWGEKGQVAGSGDVSQVSGIVLTLARGSA
jgi:cysteinyl-tRNA synthetase